MKIRPISGVTFLLNSTGCRVPHVKRNTYTRSYLIVTGNKSLSGDQEKRPVLLQSQVLTAGGRYSRTWLKVFAFAQKFVNGMERNWNQRTWYSLMPKKVYMMCFLPRVHRRKAQAQFPSFNRVARNSLSFFFFLLWMSQCKKQVGWPPQTCEQLTLDIRVVTGYCVVFMNSAVLAQREKDRIYAIKTEHSLCEIENRKRLHQIKQKQSY